VRRLALIAAAVLVAAIGIALAQGAKQSSSGTYLVRAIFDDASFAARGEDVRIAGANVGPVMLAVIVAATLYELCARG